ncbi:WD40 repeat domain-containing protein [Nostoc sp. C110]|uniref:WD40 repeat domain-containing protein n=1 Tax=Nostoc sp. C110 TaxID=3349876 RepID=UPI00370D669B
MNEAFGKVNFAAISSYGQILASASIDGTIKIWNVQIGREIRTLTAHSDINSKKSCNSTSYES